MNLKSNKVTSKKKLVSAEMVSGEIIGFTTTLLNSAIANNSKQQCNNAILQTNHCFSSLDNALTQEALLRQRDCATRLSV